MCFEDGLRLLRNQWIHLGKDDKTKFTCSVDGAPGGGGRGLLDSQVPSFCGHFVVIRANLVTE